MMLTPRQAWAWLELTDKLDRNDQLRSLKISVVGAQGTEQMIKETVKELQSE